MHLQVRWELQRLPCLRLNQHPSLRKASYIPFPCPWTMQRSFTGTAGDEKASNTGMVWANRIDRVLM